MSDNEASCPTARNYGIDLLRIVSMIMVVTLHVLGHGGVLGAVQPFTPGYSVAWLMEVACYGAVDCFGLISGYVGYGRRHAFKGVVALCLQVLFYTLGLTALALVLEPSLIRPGKLLRALFPFFGTYWFGASYWYVAAYLMLFMFMPYLDRLVDNLNETWLRGLVVAIILSFSALPTIVMYDAGYTGVSVGRIQPRTVGLNQPILVK